MPSRSAAREPEEVLFDVPAAALPKGVRGAVLRRSARRKKTVGARIEGDVLVVLAPARMSRREATRWAIELGGRLAKKERVTCAPNGDAALAKRAEELADRYLGDVSQAPIRPRSVRWVTNQNQRWGSCTPDNGDIRLSHRLQAMPDWVVDFVLIHELAHMVERNHSTRFYELVARYPKSEAADGFLQGWSQALQSRDRQQIPEAGPDDEPGPHNEQGEID